MATIHKRRLVSGEIVWELTHGTGGDRQRFTVGKTREEAQEALNQFTRQLVLHGEAPTNGSLESILGQYIRFLESNRRASTRRRYIRVLQTFHSCFLRPYHPDVTTLRQVTPAHVEAYKVRRMTGSLTEIADQEAERRDTELRKAAGASAVVRRDNAKFGWLGRKRFRPTVAPRTVNYELQVLRTFFRWAVMRNYLFVNPTVTVERLRMPKQALPKFLTSEQLTRLFSVCNERERRLFMTILLSGMRRGEAMHLTWTDVNFELGIIFVQEKPEWQWKPKTDERVIPMSPHLRGLLAQHHTERTNDGLVFPNKEGNLDTHILPKLKKVGRKAGLPNITVHALRHSFGAHLRMAGVSLADIADLLGHKDLATTQIYAKVQQEHLRTAISKLTPMVIDATPVPPAQAVIEPRTATSPRVRGLLKA
jgi:site-specific recombinase XerD